MTQKQKKAVSNPVKPAKVTAKRKTVPAMSKAAPPRTRPRSVTKVLSENEVQQRAYFLWESRGRPFGSPEVDWYQAKEQLSPE
jgi:hypothetical protein